MMRHYMKLAVNLQKEYQELWEKYTQYIKTWYKNLPYASMKNPEYYGLKTITFIGVFMLIPQNT